MSTSHREGSEEAVPGQGRRSSAIYDAVRAKKVCEDGVLVAR
jgi:hypothetical protein